MTEKLTDIKGIGEKRAASFEKLGIMTPEDLLRYSPYKYMDFTTVYKLYEVEHGFSGAFKVTVVSPARFVKRQGGMSLVVCTVKDESGQVKLTWFNQPYRAGAYKTGEELYIYGRMDIKASVRRISSPTVYRSNPLIVPVYHLKSGITQSTVRSAVKSLLLMSKGEIKETLPCSILKKYNLVSLEKALFALHYPSSLPELKSAKRRLAFEDMLMFRIAINLMRLKRKKSSGIAFDTRGVLESYKARLPFELTAGQLDIIADIEKDMQSPERMNRLIQGDVGSGKTAVAMYAMSVCGKSGMQSVLLAPTEILARQHYTSLCEIMPKEKVCLLTGSTPKKEKRIAYEKAANGEYLYITGTHALLQDGLTFKNLGLFICDEQQRFGVEQRMLLQKNSRADVLVMSATPIPRTLSLVIYGDLDVSRLKGMPKGRMPIKTRIVPQSKRVDMYKYLEAEARDGKQAYVVCPQIESDDCSPTENVTDLYDELTSLLNIKIGLLHGKMKAKDKLEAIESFRSGETKILVSTTVIEVGVDVPAAANMVIESADMFGLSQLHQLRGRIGRGKVAGYCFLVSEQGRDCERLKTLVLTSDGFEISEKDLELRGPGQFLGSQQHGMSELAMLSLACDMDTLIQAKDAADELIKSADDENNELIKSALKRFARTGLSASFN